jgi:hypothetical protein
VLIAAIITPPTPPVAHPPHVSKRMPYTENLYCLTIWQKMASAAAFPAPQLACPIPPRWHLCLLHARAPPPAYLYSSPTVSAFLSASAFLICPAVTVPFEVAAPSHCELASLRNPSPHPCSPALSRPASAIVQALHQSRHYSAPNR